MTKSLEKSILGIKSMKEVAYHPPLSRDEIEKLVADSGIKLHPDHLKVLFLTNGLEVFGGYFRIFGLKNDLDLLEWNSTGLWQFSWGTRLEGFVCFGETALGDQYAYKALDVDKPNPKIYFIEGITMTPEIICEGFDNFFSQEFSRNAIEPYDCVISEVKKRLGNLSPSEHIVYVASPLLGCNEDPGSVQKVDAASSMVINGDLCTQLESESFDRGVKEVQVYEDENSRQRIKVIWAD